MTRFAVLARFLLAVSEAAWCGLQTTKGDHLMIIGNFKLADDSYVGTIQTLAFTTEAVFEPADKKTDQSPDYRVTTGSTEIGVAWKETSKASNAYLSVQLDSPTLAAPIKCALVKTGAEQGYSLVWDRPRRKA